MCMSSRGAVMMKAAATRPSADRTQGTNRGEGGRKCHALQAGMNLPRLPALP